MLSTRLRYAIFKVENGWTRQSLSEVENLYYRRRMNLSQSSSSSGSAFQTPEKEASLKPKSRMTPPSPTHRSHASTRTLSQAADGSTYASFWSRLDGARTSPPQHNNVSRLENARSQDVSDSSSGDRTHAPPSDGKSTPSTGMPAHTHMPAAPSAASDSEGAKVHANQPTTPRAARAESAISYTNSEGEAPSKRIKMDPVPPTIR